MSGGEAYRCDTCRKRKRRCETCHERKNAARRAWRARQRKAGKCTQCAESAVDGGALCESHLLANREASRISHALARAAGRE